MCYNEALCFKKVRYDIDKMYEQTVKERSNETQRKQRGEYCNMKILYEMQYVA